MRLAVAGVLLGAVLLAPAAVRAQEIWYKTYQDAITLFNKRDFLAAEQKFLTSIKTKAAPKDDRGLNVVQISQQKGFIPEFYLALIYNELKRFDEALKYIAEAEKYFPPTGGRGPMANLDNRAGQYVGNLALAKVRAIEGKGTTTVVRGGGGDVGTPNDVGNRPPPNQTLFNTAMQDAQTALREKRYADARSAATRARDLNIDTSKANALLADITSRENRDTFDTSMAEASRALVARSYTAARAAANGAASTKVDDRQAADLLRQIDIQDLAAQLEVAITARSMDSVRVDTLKSRLAGVDATNPLLGRAEDALKNAAQLKTVRDLTSRINEQLKLRAYDRAAPLIEDLKRLDPANPLIDRARGEIAKNVGADGQLRIGVASFYRGQYQAAADALTALVAPERPRAQFYVALSLAALSLVADSEERQSTLRQQASAAFAAVRGKETDFAADLQYVSPAIKRVLGLPRQ